MQKSLTEAPRLRYAAYETTRKLLYVIRFHPDNKAIKRSGSRLEKLATRLDTFLGPQRAETLRRIELGAKPQTYNFGSHVGIMEGCGNVRRFVAVLNDDLAKGVLEPESDQLVAFWHLRNEILKFLTRRPAKER
jgi:hypothetical protein